LSIRAIKKAFTRPLGWFINQPLRFSITVTAKRGYIDFVLCFLFEIQKLLRELSDFEFVSDAWCQAIWKRLKLGAFKEFSSCYAARF
jgi:hypothetical protein